MKLNLLCLFILLPALCFADAPTLKFTAKVVNRNGNPIENAKVFVNFTGSKAKVIEGRTNKEGLFTATGSTTPIGGVTVKKEGYYLSGYSFENMIIEHLDERKKGLLNRWQPWNPIINIVLKEKKNPIPMYAKGTFGYIEAPALEEPIGYDLAKGDWVIPYGKGEKKDFIFVFRARYDGIKDWEASYSLTFSDRHDGIIEYYPDENDYSEYKWPYKAPQTGYKSEINRYKVFQPNGYSKTNYDKKRRYIFRIRTKVDDKGNIIKAKYGKLKNDIEFLPNKKISFSYIFNPTGTRNLEYSGQNLFTSD